MKTKHLWIIAAAIAACAGLPLLAAEPPIAEVDKKIADAVNKFSYWQGMLLPVTLVIVAAMKHWLKLIPDRYLPWTAPIIGGLLDMAAAKFGLWTGNAAVGAAMGGLATWAHQALFVQPSDVVEEEGPPHVPPNLPVWLIVGALATSLVFTGCQSAYRVVISITEVESSAMREWARLHNDGVTSADFDKKIIAAHDVFRGACAVTQAALERYRDGGSETEYIRALEATKAAITPLLEMLKPLLNSEKAATLKAAAKKANVL